MKTFERFFMYRMIYYGFPSAFLLRPASFFKALQLWSGNARHVKTCKLWNGTTFLMRPQTADFQIWTEIYIKKVYDFVNLPADATIIDLGAHIGLFSVWCSKKSPNSHIYAYEPSEENFAMLQKNLQLNKLQQVKIFKNAVYHKNARKKFFVTKDTVCNSLYSDFDTNIAKVSEVTCVTLPDIFRKNHIQRCHLLKLDIEGAEYDVLRNTPKEIFNKIDALVIEYHKEPDELKDILLQNGFTVTDNPGTPGYSASFIYATRNKFA